MQSLNNLFWNNMRSPSFCYLLSRVLSGPSEVLFTLLIFIISKNLNATALQLTLMASFKPITSIFSFYISTTLHGRSHLIRPYIILNTLFGIAPCLLFPFVDNVWYYIFSYAVYMITRKAKEPAWIEFLKGHLELPTLSKLVSRGTSVAYLIGMVLPPILSLWLDGEIWKILFVGFAFFQLLNVINIFFMQPRQVNTIEKLKIPYHQKIIDPLKKGFQLLKHNPGFSHYLALYFI